MILNQYGDFFTDAAGFVTSIFSGAAAPPKPPPPPKPWYETGEGMALLGVGAVATLGLGYVAYKRRHRGGVQMTQGYGMPGRRRRRSRR